MTFEKNEIKMIERLQRPHLSQALFIYRAYYKPLYKLLLKVGLNNCLVLAVEARKWSYSPFRACEVGMDTWDLSATYIIKHDFKPKLTNH